MAEGQMKAKSEYPPRNYQKELERTLETIRGKVPRLLLHSCCAPCSSYVLEYLSEYFDITLYYYNPNISTEEEFTKRLKELERFVSEVPHKNPIQVLAGAYEPEMFYEMAKGLEEIPEGGSRCYHCYELRLQDTARIAREGQFDYFTTTLSISPLKNAHWLNEIGQRLQQEYEITYLVSDFKKKGGYLRSIELSREYDLYRQNFCGCIFSQKAIEQPKTP